MGDTQMSSSEMGDAQILDPLSSEELIEATGAPLSSEANIDTELSNMGAVASVADILQGNFVRVIEHFSAREQSQPIWRFSRRTVLYCQ